MAIKIVAAACIAFFIMTVLTGTARAALQMHAFDQAQTTPSANYKTATAVSNITISAQPNSIAYDSNNGHIYVTSGSTVSVIDSSNNVIREISIPDVTSMFSGQTPEPNDLIVYDPQNSMIYLTSPFYTIQNLAYVMTVYAINDKTNSIANTIQFNLPPNANLATVYSSGTFLYNPVNDMLYFFMPYYSDTGQALVEIINPATNQQNQASLPTFIDSVTCNPSTGDMYGVNSLEIATVSCKTNSITSTSSNQAYFQSNFIPINLVFDSNNGYLYGIEPQQLLEDSYGALMYQTQLVEIDPQTYNVLQTINVENTTIMPGLNDPIRSLFFDQANGLLYVGDIYSFSVFAVDPADSVLQNITAYGVPAQMAFNSKNGELYVISPLTIDSTFPIVAGSSPVMKPAHTVSAIYLGGVESEDTLEIESITYDPALSELPFVVIQTQQSLDPRYHYIPLTQTVYLRIPNHEDYAGEDFSLIVNVKNTGQRSIVSPSNLEAIATIPATDAMGESPLLSSQLISPATNIAPGQTAQLNYEVNANWNYAATWNQLIWEIPIFSDYTRQSGIAADINTILTAHNLGWYVSYADDNAQNMKQAITFSSPPGAARQIDEPSEADLNSAAYGVASAFANNQVVLGVNYSIAFPGITTTYRSSELQNSVAVLMPPNKVALLDFLFIYDRNAKYVLEPLDATLSALSALSSGSPLEIAKISAALLGLSIPSLDVSPLQVMYSMLKMGIEINLITAVADPSGNYTQIVSPPSQPTFLSDRQYQNNSQLLENLYYYYSYLNASVESNAKANAAFEAGSFQYATIQTANAQEYGNQSSSYLEKAIPMIEQFVNQPAITEFLNSSTFQKVQAFVSQNPDMILSNSSIVLLQDFGLPTSFNFSQILNESFMPINATAFGELLNPASALALSDQYELIYLQNTQAPTSSPQPSPVTSIEILLHLSPTEITVVIAIAVIMSSAASIIVIHKRKQRARRTN